MQYFGANVIKNPSAEEGLDNWVSSGVTVETGGSAGNNRFELEPTAYMTQEITGEDLPAINQAYRVRFDFRLNEIPTQDDTTPKAFAVLSYLYTDGTVDSFSAVCSENVQFIGTNPLTWNLGDGICPVKEVAVAKAILTIKTENLTGGMGVDFIRVQKIIAPEEVAFENIFDSLKEGTAPIIIFTRNNHLLLDRWGISPDYFQRIKNAISNSSFEWYDPTTNAPRDWIGTGIVTTEEKWDGEVSLKLDSGQEIEVATRPDPTDWNDQKTRVSFRHKGGAIRAKILYESETERGLLPVTTIGTESPQLTRRSYCNFVPRTAGGFVTAYIDESTWEIFVAFANDESFTTNSYTIQSVQGTGIIFNRKDISGELSPLALYRKKNGSIILIVSDRGQDGTGASLTQYISTSGNGNDFVFDHYINQYGVGITSYAVTNSIANIPVEMEDGNGDKFLLLTAMRGDDYVGLIAGRYAGFVSYDDGDSWTQVVSVSRQGLFEAFMAIGQPLQLPSGRIIIEVKLETTRYFLFSDGYGAVGTWSFYTQGDVTIKGHDGSLYFDKASQTAYRMTGSGVVGLFKYKNPTNEGFIKSESWELVSEEVQSNMQSPAMFSETPLGRVHIVHYSGVGEDAITAGVSLDYSAQPYHLYDNSVDEGLTDAVFVRDGLTLDYPAREEWAYPTPPNLTERRNPGQDIAQGFCTFYFEPLPEAGPVRVIFENIDTDPAYIDAVQMEPDFTGKWPSLYKPGPNSTPPEKHSDTHSKDAPDEITPEQIDAADRVHTHEDLYLNKANTEEYTPAADYHPATKKYVDDNSIKQFKSLTDTPASYTGQAGKFVAVNQEEDGLVFIDPPAGGGFAPLTTETQFLCTESSQLLLG